MVRRIVRMKKASRVRRAWVRHMKTDEFYKPQEDPNEPYYRFKKWDKTPRQKYGKEYMTAYLNGFEDSHCPECWKIAQARKGNV